MKYLLLCFLCLSFSAFAQIEVVNQISGEPIPYAHVKVPQKNVGKISNYKGVFELDSTLMMVDSLLVSCIGYESRVTSVSDLTKEKRIELTPVSQEVEEVVIARKRGRFKNKEMGVTKKPYTKFFDYSVTAMNGTIRAVYIPNTYSIPGVLKSANVYVTDIGHPDAHYRVHVYETSPLEIRPGKELTTSNLIASGTEGNEWVKIDLSEERILVPENGCFIGIEWFDHPDSGFFQDTLRSDGVVMIDGKLRDTTYQHVRSGNGVVLGSRSEEYRYAKNKVWYKTHLSNDWVNWCTSVTDESKFHIPDTLANGNVITLNQDNSFFRIPCIYIDVSFPKDKVDMVFEAPKKRKLNRIERVKEDNFEYPQASVVELFSSLKKAVERDEVIYILRFLCVYKNDEQEEILASLSESKEEHGNYLTEEEKTRIIERFELILEHLNEDALIKVDSHHFELHIEEERYNLIVEDGKWKINPYSYKVISLD